MVVASFQIPMRGNESNLGWASSGKASVFQIPMRGNETAKPVFEGRPPGGFKSP